MSDSKFTFRQHDRIGDPSAEDDQFLYECFVDNGNLDILVDCQDSRAIAAGRTGSGKSALLRQLKNTRDNVIEIEPQSLALGYISNSTILSFFTQLGVKLDLFYRSLWLHVFVVELIKFRYKMQDEADKLKFFDELNDILHNKRGRIEAFKYLNTWGTKFWQTTEDRIKETTTIIEKDLSSNAGLDVAHIATLQSGGKLHLSEQQSREIKKRGEDIVNSVQMSKLNALLDSLDEDILTDRKRRYYIIIDRLDEPWVEEETRYRLIRGLIETVRDFNRRVQNAKIIVALRNDLIYRIYKYTSDSGFQEEKYLSLNLNITWSHQSLKELLSKRTQTLVKQRYTKQPVTLSDILPGKIGRRKNDELAIDYLIDRTLLRPRDAIHFLNSCMALATSKTMITPQMLLQAEAEYSLQRRNALADEWSERYPYLVQFSGLFKGYSPHFRLNFITKDQLETLCLHVMMLPLEERKTTGEDYRLLERYFNGVIGEEGLRCFLAECFYTVGLIGLKLASHLEPVWSSNGPATISSAEINDDVTVYVHKAFWRALGICDSTTS